MPRLQRFAILLLFFSTQSFAEVKGAPSAQAYQRDLRALEAAEAELVSKLKLTLSPFQIKSNISYKVVLRDQFGEDWLFKAGENAASDGAIAVYRIYQALGVFTPETYPLRLRLNGKLVEGSLQRVYATKKSEEIFSFVRFNEPTLNYFATTHALDWLTLNHHVHFGQFILLAEGRSDGLAAARVDNSVNWFLINQDKLDIRYESPTLSHIYESGYTTLWLNYLLLRMNQQNRFSKLDADAPLAGRNHLAHLARALVPAQASKHRIDFRAVSQHLLLYQQLSDEWLKDVLRPGLANDLVNMSNSGVAQILLKAADLAAVVTKREFLKKMLERKNTAFESYRAFFGSLRELAGAEDVLVGELDPTFLASKHDHLRGRLRLAQQRLAEMPETAPTHEQEVSVAVSYQLYLVIRELLPSPMLATQEMRQKKFQEVLRELERYRVDPRFSAEVEARKNAIANVKKLERLVAGESSFGRVFNKLLNPLKIFEADFLDDEKKL